MKKRQKKPTEKGLAVPSDETLIYRKGVNNKAIPVEVALKEIDRIEQVHGRIEPRTLLEENSRPGSPLHGFFEWDDTVAAESWRLWQARALIRSIMVEKSVEGSQEPVRLTLYHSAKDEDGRAYFSISRLANDIDLFNSAVESLTNQTNALSRSVASLNSIAPLKKRPIVEKIEDATKKIGKLTKKLNK